MKRLPQNNSDFCAHYKIQVRKINTLGVAKVFLNHYRFGFKPIYFFQEMKDEELFIKISYCELLVIVLVS